MLPGFRGAMFEFNLPQAAHPFPILQTSFAEDERDELRRLWRTACVHPSLELVSRSVSSGVEGAGLWFRFGTLFAVYVPGTIDRCPYVAHGRQQKIVHGRALHVEVDREQDEQVANLARKLGYDVLAKSFQLYPPSQHKVEFPLGLLDLSFGPVVTPRAFFAETPRALASCEEVAAAPAPVAGREPCSECRGTGVYVGFTSREPCRACGGGHG